MNDETLASDILRGVPAIAEFTGENQRQTYAFLETGRLPGFKLKGNKIWRARRSTLRKHYEALEGLSGGQHLKSR